MKHCPRTTVQVAEIYIRNVWHYADALTDVKLPFSAELEELAKMSSLLVTRTLFSKKLRIRGDHDAVSGVLKMYCKTQMGSARIP